MQAIATHCPYCALQCGMHIADSPGLPIVSGNARFPVNKGGLCVKGWTSAATLGHRDRITTPLKRDSAGHLVEASWEDAFALVAQRIAAVQAEHGPNAVGVLGGGSLTNEKAYLVGKFARVALRTANVDYNGRFCMSSAAGAMQRALGIDRGLPFPLEDIARTKVLLLVGGNPAETMPPLMQYFQAQQEAGGRLVVVDPRRTATAAWAARHLAIRPGSDLALSNGLLHVLIRDGLIDNAFIEARTEGFDAVRSLAASYWPERVEGLTGIPQRDIVETAHLLGGASSAMVISARGPEQQAQGVNNVLGYINVALALGLPGREASGVGTLTGQGNGQGGREHGQKSDQLPGYRRLDDPDARRHVAQVWNVEESTIPAAGKSAFELLDALGGEIKALFVMGFNPAVSAPDSRRIAERLGALDLLVVSDFFLSETTEKAHLVLPAAQWAEEDGTMTNLEGRVILRRRAVAPPAGVRTDIEIVCGLANALGRGSHFKYGGAQEVFAELGRATAGGVADYSGISYERIDAENGVFWPCPASDHPGTPRLFQERFPTTNSRAKFHPVTLGEIADRRDAEHPLLLTTGRVLHHYQSGNQTRRIDELRELMPHPVAEMHPAAAARAGVAEGDQVTLTTRRGQVTLGVTVTRKVREDTVFVPFHWGGSQSANTLTGTALDPISRMPEFKISAARAERAPSTEEPE